MISYCHGCGVYAALDAAALCDRCRADWQPAGSKPDDLGIRRQPQPLGSALLMGTRCPITGDARSMDSAGQTPSGTVASNMITHT